MIVHEVSLAPGVGAWFTGREVGDEVPDVVGAGLGGGNLAHRRPHRPDELARARDHVGSRTATSPADWHLMRQVHGAEVGVIDDSTPPGAELRGVDALVTGLEERALAVQVADCVPVLLAGRGAVGAVHAGRNGLVAGVVPAAVTALRRIEGEDAALRAAIGPAIGGCCYEVPASMRDDVARRAPAAAATTTWGTPSLDLPRAVGAELEALDVDIVERLETCTRCDPASRWFSHRADPGGGRQIGLVVRRRSEPEPARDEAGA